MSKIIYVASKSNQRDLCFRFVSTNDDELIITSQNRPGSEGSQFYQPEAQFSLHDRGPAGTESLLMNRILLRD